MKTVDPTVRRWARILASLAISGVACWLAFRAIDPAELVAMLRSTVPGWLLTALLLYWIELGVRVQRWLVILRPVKQLRLGQVADALLVGYAANNAIPARLGELVRADYIGRRFGFPRFSAISTIVIERAFDLAAVTLCAAAGAVALLQSRSSLLWPLVTGVGIVTVAIVVVFLAMYAMHAGTSAALSRRFPRFAPRLSALSAGLESLRQPGVVWSLVGLSAAAWVWNGLAMAAVLRAVGVVPNATVMLLVLGVSGIAAALPSAPAGIGTLQFAFVTVLAATGHSPTAGFAAALLVQIFLLGSVTLVGVILFALWGLRSASARDGGR
jgi:hypothetical protein